MSIRSAIYSLLDAATSNKIFPLAAVQEETDPYVVYGMRSEATRDQTKVNVFDVTLLISVYASDRNDCLALATEIYDGLELKSGSYSDKTLIGCSWTSEAEDYIPDLKKWEITQEYNLKFD